MNVTQMMGEFGKKWVEEQFQKEAQNKGIDLSLEWGPSSGRYPLAIETEKKRVIAKFSEEDLGDCLKPGETQNKVHNRIKGIIESMGDKICKKEETNPLDLQAEPIPKVNDSSNQKRSSFINCPGAKMKPYVKAGRLCRLFGWIYLVFGVIITIGITGWGFLLGGIVVLHLKVGTAIKEHKKWGRTVGIILGLIHLPAAPIGTLFGASTLWYLIKGWEEGCDEKIEEYKKVIKANPNDADAHWDIGLIYGKKGLWDKAIEEFKEAIRIKPGYAQKHIIV